MKEDIKFGLDWEAICLTVSVIQIVCRVCVSKEQATGNKSTFLLRVTDREGSLVPEIVKLVVEGEGFRL